MTLRVRNATKTGCGRDILPTDWIYVFAKQGHFLIGHVRREGLIQFQNLLTPWILWGGSRTIEDSVWHYCRSCCTNVITKAQGSYFSRHWFSFKKVIHDLLICVAIMMRTTSSRKDLTTGKLTRKSRAFCVMEKFIYWFLRFYIMARKILYSYFLFFLFYESNHWSIKTLVTSLISIPIVNRHLQFLPPTTIWVPSLFVLIALGAICNDVEKL